MVNAREIATLRDSMQRAHAAGETPALVTLLQVDGSAYRRPGAKMLVRPGGGTCGMISGGCLEPELAELAQGVIAANEGRRVRYDLSEDEVWGLGLGCGGAIDLYIEPLPPQSAAADWIRRQAAGERALAATVFSAPVPRRELYRTEGDGTLRSEWETDEAGDLSSPIAERAAELLAGGDERSRLESVSLRQPENGAAPDRLRRGEGRAGGEIPVTVEVFFDISTPAPELVLFGGGPGAAALAARSAELGFRVIVVDPREGVANAAAFPEAEIIGAQPEQYPDCVPISAHSYVVIMNHHLERDREALVFTLDRKPAYVAMLGPRRRFEKVLTTLCEHGRVLDDHAVKQVHSPAGLDIGAEGPDEIALSILAEILAVRRGHGGGTLTDKRAGIHEPDRLAAVVRR